MIFRKLFLKKHILRHFLAYWTVFGPENKVTQTPQELNQDSHKTKGIYTFIAEINKYKF